MAVKSMPFGYLYKIFNDSMLLSDSTFLTNYMEGINYIMLMDIMYIIHRITYNKKSSVILIF